MYILVWWLSDGAEVKSFDTLTEARARKKEIEEWTKGNDDVVIAKVVDTNGS